MHLSTTWLLSLITWAWVLPGCHVQPPPSGQLDVSGLGRVYKVGPHLYRGPQPTKAQFVAIRALEPDRQWCVIKLNTEIPGDGGDDAGNFDMNVIHEGWLPFGPVTHKQITEAMDDTAACLDAGLAVYGHCLHGEDRTGLWLGLWRVRSGSFPMAAFSEMVAYGFHDGETNKPGLPLFIEAFQRETGYQP